LTQLLPEVEILESETQFPEITIPAGQWKELARKLRFEEDLLFDFLFCLTGVDWVEYLSVVYHLRSTVHGHTLVVKAKIEDREHPIMDTVSDIWRTAEFHEREAYDFFGIHFHGHPDLRRIFLEDDWEGWPLRKDYEDPVNMVML